MSSVRLVRLNSPTGSCPQNDDEALLQTWRPPFPRRSTPTISCSSSSTPSPCFRSPDLLYIEIPCGRWTRRIEGEMQGVRFYKSSSKASLPTPGVSLPAEAQHSEGPWTPQSAPGYPSRSLWIGRVRGRSRRRRRRPDFEATTHSDNDAARVFQRRATLPPTSQLSFPRRLRAARPHR